MNVHKNARLAPLGRAELVRRVREQNKPVMVVATAFGVSPGTVRKWVRRFIEEGQAGLDDRSSRPHRLRRPTPAPVVERVAELRRRRWTGQQIPTEVGVSPATVSRILRRLGLNRLAALEPAEPVRRYERAYPGELIHIDIKKLGRIDGIGHRITAIDAARAPAAPAVKAWAGNSFTSASATPRGSPSSRFCPMKRRKAQWPS